MTLTPAQKAQIDGWKFQIPVLESTIAFKKAIISARNEENLAQRQYIALSVGSGATLQATNDYTARIRDRWKAERDFLEFEVFQMESQIKTWRKLIEQAESSVELVS